MGNHIPKGTAAAFGRLQERRLRHSKLFQPEYSENFRCVGPTCEDSCCEEWTIHVDQSTFEKYQQLPPGPLRTIIDENILRTPQQAPAAFAQIHMNAQHTCPLLSDSRLCQMQVEHGEELLPHTCATYPRVNYCIDGVTENALSLSCPEAARLVLLNPHLPMGVGHDGGIRIETDRTNRSDPYLPHFWSLRNLALELVQNRVYPLWQRLFLIGMLSRRFDTIAPDERPQKVPQLLAEFRANIAARNLQAAMDALPVEHTQQLDLVLLLAGMLLHQSHIRPRFLETIQAFTQGIGNGPGATLASLTACYSAAHDSYYAPFFQAHPYILENYLINTMFRSRFPFGRDWEKTGAAPSMTRESTLLTVQFSLMKGLLIGVAGYHREVLSASHVVHTVQAASKHFEHHTEFLKQAHTLLVEKRMDGPMGMAVLLRNAKSRVPMPALPPIYAPGPAQQAVVFPVRVLPPD